MSPFKIKGPLVQSLMRLARFFSSDKFVNNPHVHLYFISLLYCDSCNSVNCLKKSTGRGECYRVGYIYCLATQATGVVHLGNGTGYFSVLRPQFHLDNSP